ncbi:hypothetical protein BJX61DRAFT_539160 [Aspergillus egyptiacus]|nr:hypothetical protein BJX61DRAFT_539160 [Aspergillus egyptiacus]
MYVKAFLLTLYAQSTLATLESFTLLNSTTIEDDPAIILLAHSPDNAALLTRAVNSSPASIKIAQALACYNPAFPVTCQSSNLYCKTNSACYENQSCIWPESHNCCLYRYYYNKPYQCIQYSNGNIGCQL